MPEFCTSTKKTHYDIYMPESCTLIAQNLLWQTCARVVHLNQQDPLRRTYARIMYLSHAKLIKVNLCSSRAPRPRRPAIADVCLSRAPQLRDLP